jgi:hypothetical protein
MQEKPKKEDEYLIVGSDGQEELNIPILMGSLLTQLMGFSIDCARMAVQNEQAFKQFERSVKDKNYNLIKMASKILAEHGYNEPGR